MSLLIFDRYGGRQRRYKANPGRLLELLDPWERRTLAFRNEWVHDLWLCRRADPTVQGVVVHPEPLNYVKLGERRSCVADLAVKRASGVVYEIVQVGDKDKCQRRAQDLHIAAAAHSVQWGLTSPSELASHASLIDNMERIRQTLVVWLDHDLIELRECVLGALRGEPLTRKKLKAQVDFELGAAMGQRTDVAIYRLFFERKLSLDLNRRYDDDCVIEVL